ncbi:hypothetical protein CEXT_749471 [Caerostris extrusa]|uniref:Uncharacterized protein n=1 Tax=Caerostris extrusa TaxID=172846 RepID=A0AAV4R9W1_CAEEX|nr:hypothetical protein CEXT_749471 [Caerostris extrusa]
MELETFWPSLPKSKWMEAAPPVSSTHPRPPNRLFLEGFYRKMEYPPNQITPHQANPHRHLASDEHW